MIPDAPAGSGSQRRLLIGENGVWGLVNEIPEFMIPAAIARDTEINAAAIRALLGLTEDEQNDLLTGASLLNGVLTFVQNDGTNVQITLPAGAVDDELQVASSATYSAGSVALTAVVTKHLELGDIVSFEIPANINDSASNLLFRTSDGSTFTGVYSVVDRNGDNLTPADFDSGQRVFLQRISSNEMAVVAPIAGGVDGVVVRGTFSADGSVLILTVDTGRSGKHLFRDGAGIAARRGIRGCNIFGPGRVLRDDAEQGRRPGELV